MKKITLFTDLTLHLIPPVVVILALATFLNYYNVKQSHLQYYKQQNRSINIAVNNLLQFRDAALEALESNLDQEMRHVSSALVDDYFKDTKKIEDADLYQIHKELGLNNELEDIYIIDSAGIIVNTTFTKDQQLNLCKFGEEHQLFLRKVRKSGHFYRDRLTKEESTNRTRIYSYQATADKKYIIELGFYSEKISHIDLDFQLKIKQIAKSFSHILDIELFLASEDFSGFNNKVKVKEEHREIFTKTYKEKKHHTIEEQEDDQEMIYDYFFVEMRKTELYKGYVILIKSTGEILKYQLNSELNRQAAIYGFALLILSLTVFFKARNIASPLKHFVAKTRLIANKKFDERVEVKGYNEIAELAENFNFMLKELENSYNILEDRVSERTQELQRQTSKLEHLNAMKDKFFSIIAHDLKNPFNTIIGFAELLTVHYETLSNEQRIDFLETIYRASKRGYDLLENLLDWSRSQTDMLEIHKQTINITDIIFENLLFFSSMAQSKKIKLETQTKTDIFAFADYNMIQTVIRNLCSNALKFTNKEGRITINARKIEVDKKYFIEVEICDNGVGISAKNIEKLFRIDVTYSTIGTAEEKGTGLGLILCKEFIDKNEGTIWVESGENAGSRFFFRIPAA